MARSIFEISLKNSLNDRQSVLEKRVENTEREYLYIASEGQRETVGRAFIIVIYDDKRAC